MSETPPAGPSPRPSPVPRADEPAEPEERNESAEAAVAAAPAPRSARHAERRARQARLRRLRWIMIAALAIAVVAGTASIALALHGSTSRRSAASSSASSSAASSSAPAGAALTDPDRVTAFLAGATSDIAAVTTYDYRRLDDALSAGLAVTTGSYREAFRTALTGDVARSAAANETTHDFEVLDLGIGSINAAGTRANVLIFGRQLVSDKTHKQPQASLVTLRATIVRQGDRYLIADLQQDADAGSPPGTAELARAIEAGRSEVVNALTYTRAQFDSDLRRAQAGAVAPLLGELTREAEATRAAMTKGAYDLTGVVVASAVKSAAPTTVSLLVAAEASRIGGAGSQVTAVRYEVTVTYVDQRWMVSQIQALSTQ